MEIEAFERFELELDEVEEDVEEEEEEEEDVDGIEVTDGATDCKIVAWLLYTESGNGVEEGVLEDVVAAVEVERVGEVRGLSG